jgi:hypothetical protein
MIFSKIATYRNKSIRKSDKCVYLIVTIVTFLFYLTLLKTQLNKRVIH